MYRNTLHVLSAVNGEHLVLRRVDPRYPGLVGVGRSYADQLNRLEDKKSKCARTIGNVRVLRRRFGLVLDVAGRHD